MHSYGLEWTPEFIKTTIDGKEVLNFPFDKDLFTKGNFDSKIDNPWKDGEKSAPFDQEFFLIMNVAVGGTNSYFVDDKCGKTWNNNDGHAPNTFWNSRDQWYPSWNYPESNDAAMKIDYVKIW